MKKYLLAGLLSIAAAVHAEEQAPTVRYEQTILAILAFGVDNNKQVYNHPELLALAQKHKDARKIKRLFMTYFEDKGSRYTDIMQKDPTQNEAIRLFLKSLGKNPDDEILEMQIGSAPNSMVEEGLKSTIEDAKISADDLNALAKLAGELSQRLSPTAPETTATAS